MEDVWVWILLFLLVFGFAALPNWRHTKGRWPYHRQGAWSYVPAVTAIGAFIIVVGLAWFGFIVIAFD